MRICWVGVKAVTVVLLLLSASPAFGFMHHVFEGWPSRLHVPARPESRYFCRPGRRGSQLALSGEELAVGAVVAGVATIAASRALSTLAGAFELADYRTTSGHDLRLDERLQSKRRQLLPTSEAAPSTRSGSSSEEGVSDSGSAVDMDWREEVRLASQLPEDGDFGRGGSTVVKIVEARYPT